MQQLLLSEIQFKHTVKRLCYELIENHQEFENTVVVGIQPRGSLLSKLICEELRSILKTDMLLSGAIDITFHRDDLHHQHQPLLPSVTEMDFNIEGKKVILVDDVLFTGRTIRAAMDALLSYGRPNKIELLVLVDRLYSRDLPVQAYYTGKSVDTVATEKVKVEWMNNNTSARVWLMHEAKEQVQE
jgi:pyrimidine operon attenuation protein/uracil phosphoribosyltransferase